MPVNQIVPLAYCILLKLVFFMRIFTLRADTDYKVLFTPCALWRVQDVPQSSGFGGHAAPHAIQRIAARGGLQAILPAQAGWDCLKEVMIATN